MQRIATSTRAVDLYGAGKDGFRDGDLPNSILPTDLSAAWFNFVQEELARVVEGSGQVLDGAQLSQVTKAIKRFAGANVKTVTAGASALTVDDAGAVLIDASAGNVTLTLPAANVVAGLGIEFNFYRTDATGNVVTINRAGADTIDGANSFTIPGQFAYRSIRGNANAAWATTSVSSTATSSKIQSIAASIAGNALTVTVNPTSLDFRSSALSVGVPNTRTTAAPLSLVVPAGATLGTVSGLASRIIVLLIDNAGALEVAVVNVAGGVDLSETGLISTTSLSAAADAADSVYSTVSRANVPYRVIGYLQSTQAVAGTWATAPAVIQGAGGLALSSFLTFGVNQAWQDVTSNRSFGVTYTNTKPYPIDFAISANSSASSTLTMVVNGVDALRTPVSVSTAVQSYGPISVPPGHTYSANMASPVNVYWSEFR